MALLFPFPTFLFVKCWPWKKALSSVNVGEVPLGGTLSLWHTHLHLLAVCGDSLVSTSASFTIQASPKTAPVLNFFPHYSKQYSTAASLCELTIGDLTHVGGLVSVQSICLARLTTQALSPESTVEGENPTSESCPLTFTHIHFEAHAPCPLKIIMWNIRRVCVGIMNICGFWLSLENPRSHLPWLTSYGYNNLSS